MITVRNGKIGTVPGAFSLWGNHPPKVGERRRWRPIYFALTNDGLPYRIVGRYQPWQDCLVEQVGPGNHVRISKL
jgi:hypothetical protein